ncbi:hypothetical protein GH714_037143 [Hevea brasiliensis]|uniref:Uncharacterized protein n=1 Tax=Hevea brasiliensis TaxID=3981 RepID=A0A6A6MR49_HEVBR|nr:hypothetical protein GH714_037143 [Hevea brasiliensis]
MLPWAGISCCLSAAVFYLLGRSSGRDAEVLKSVTRVNQLKELGVRGASAFVLTVGGEVFEESGRSLVCGTLDYLQGLKILGVKHIERVLPMAVKDDIGTIQVQHPHKGHFMYLLGLLMNSL